MPFTRGDARQFLIGLALAVVTALIFNLEALIGVSLREVDWSAMGWDLLDNLVQSILVYVSAWWGITRSGIVRKQELVDVIKQPIDGHLPLP